MEKEKKRQLYEWFGFLGIKEEELKQFYTKWKDEFDKEWYEKTLPKIPEKKADEFEQKIEGIERVIDVYLKEEHKKEEIYNFIKNIYMEAGYNDKHAEGMFLSAIIFRIISPTEFYNFMESKA